MSWTQEDVTEHLAKMGRRVPIQAPTPAERPKVVRERMNNWERLYAQYLGLLLHAGEIRWYGFEAMKLRLAGATFYTPDFAVITKAGELEYHEVKGMWRDDAVVKFKLAAEHFPFRFIALSKTKSGEWEIIKDLKGKAV